MRRKLSLLTSFTFLSFTIAPPSVLASIHSASQSFQYDDLNRLTQASGSYGNFSYAYDPLGNMLDKEGPLMTYGENSAGPHAVTSTQPPSHFATLPDVRRQWGKGAGF